MSSQADADQLKGRAEAIKNIAAVSTLLRNAVQAALPVSPEEYLTISIPGTVIDVGQNSDFNFDGSADFKPAHTSVAESKLVDTMVPLAHVQLGNTGRSVWRSYDRALDLLVPVKAGRSGITERSPGDKTYDDSMSYLTKPRANGRTPIDIYLEKLQAWSDTNAEWDAAKAKAKQDAIASSSIAAQQERVFEEWNSSNYRSYKNKVQAKYMDWVTNGDKYNVEFHFGMVDTDSVMAKIENSKQSLRDSKSVDVNGSDEWPGVTLFPPNWHNLCVNKSNGWYTAHKEFTPDDLNDEISRLNKLEISYKAMKAALTAKKFPIDETTPGTNPASTPTDTDLQNKLQALYEAQGKVSFIVSQWRKNGKAAKDLPGDADYQKATDTLAKAQADVDNQVKLNTIDEFNKRKAGMTENTDKNLGGFIDSKIEVIEQQKALLVAKRDAAIVKQGVPAIVDAKSDGKTPGGTQVAVDGDEKADPALLADQSTTGNNQQNQVDADPWTSITCAFSSQDQSSSANASASGFSVGGGFGWGLWSAGGSYAHEESKADSQGDMSSCDVKVSFSALVVQVNRPWLHAELFEDQELSVADNVKLSPGAASLTQLIDTQDIPNLKQYNLFPAYPSALIIAADTVLEFDGDTQHIEAHFSSSSDTASASVGWGPWKVSSNYHRSSSHEDHKFESTSTGCRIMFRAPQIIGWVSQIVPEMPRSGDYDSMVQGATKSYQGIQ